nr:cylicin-1-like [Penaeus vannamei]
MKSESAEGTGGARDGPAGRGALVLEDTEEDLSSSESSCDYEGESKDKRRRKRRKRRRRRRDSSGSVWSCGDLGSEALGSRDGSPPSTSEGGRAGKESEEESAKEGGRRDEGKDEEDALGDSDTTAKEKRIESDSAGREKGRRKEAKRNRSEGEGDAPLFSRKSCPPATSESPPLPPAPPPGPGGPGDPRPSPQL